MQDYGILAVNPEILRQDYRTTARSRVLPVKVL